MLGERQKKGTQAPALQVAELSDRFASIYAYVSLSTSFPNIISPLFRFVFQNVDSEDAWMLRETALHTSAILSDHIGDKLPPAGVISHQVRSFYIYEIPTFSQEKNSLTLAFSPIASIFEHILPRSSKNLPQEQHFQGRLLRPSFPV